MPKLGTTTPMHRPRPRAASSLASGVRASPRLETTMDWQEPFLLYDADALDADRLAEAGRAYCNALSRLASPASCEPPAPAARARS